MNIRPLLTTIENEITLPEERHYFWIHSVRYQKILEYIQSLAGDKKLRILDIGCFPYHVGKALEQMGHDVYGIASQHEPVKNKHIAVLNIEKDTFPYDDNFFDLVLCNEVVEHLPQSPVPVLQEIYRVTKKGGYCMVTTPNIVRSINRGKMLFGRTVMFPVAVYFEEQGKGNNIYHRHNREYVLGELATLFAKTKWQMYKKGYFISYTPFRKRAKPDNPLVWLGKFINYLVMNMIPSLQDTLIVVGKK